MQEVVVLEEHIQLMLVLEIKEQHLLVEQVVLEDVELKELQEQLIKVVAVAEQEILN